MNIDRYLIGLHKSIQYGKSCETKDYIDNQVYQNRIVVYTEIRTLESNLTAFKERKFDCSDPITIIELNHKINTTKANIKTLQFILETYGNIYDICGIDDE